MPATRYKLLRILAGLFIFLLGCPPPSQPPRQAILTGIATIGQAGFTILGQVFVLTPNSTGSFLLQVRDPDTGDVVPNGTVTVALNDPDGASQRVFEGTTDAQGLVQVSFTVPENVTNPNQVLVVESQSTAGTAKFEESVYVGRAYNVLVSTDKPVYQPGQTIHVRALALDTLKLEAANAQEITLIVADPNGNKLARQSLTTSKYGIAAFDFDLDTLATSGDYIITAEIGPVTSSRSVEVKPYTLPRFKVEFDSDKKFYLPGETATGVIDANYFFGKPVDGGQVTIRGFVTDIDRFQVFEITGATDANGQYDYTFEVPDYFVGQLENNAAEIDLEISVVDAANHAETIDETITVAEKIILLEAIPESGTLRAGIENRVYVDATYPDGQAAPSTIQVDTPLLTEPLTLTTDAYGLAHFNLTPELGMPTVITLTATTTPTRNTPEGTSVTQVLTLDADETATSVLLRPERAEYHIGDTMNLDIHVAGNARTVYLDVIKDRQTFGMVVLPVEDNLAQAAIDIDGSLLGTLELNAYVINDQGDIVRDRRLVLVNPAPAQVQINSDAGTYLPGETATVDIQVMRDGAPMVGALGISIVDESVFSVGAQDPGFARTYFLLERELLEPRYEIRDFTSLDDDESSPYDETPDSVRYGLHVPLQAPGNDQRPSSAAIAQARNTALMGLFAHELHAASLPLPSAAQPATATAASSDQWGWLNRIMLMAPLLGLAFYDGSKSRRRLLIATVLFTLAAGFYAACSPAAAPAASVAGDAAAPAETTATRGDAETPRLRQYFPEALYWMPELETDAEGRAQIELPLADSITTWRVSVVASDEAGNLGSGQGSLRVFQPFFVEPDMPRFLTVGDELDVPVALYNYLDEPQTVELTVKSAPWFDLRGDATVSVNLAPNEVSVAYIPINVTGFGTQDFEVTAIGNTASDAIVRSVEIIPNGSPQASVVNGQLEAAHSFAVAVPASAIPGTGRVTVKLYPGIVSQAIDGLAAMLQEPYGCFEQTSSVTYPNVLVLDYLRTMDQQSPTIELRANAYINAGYQRLLTFEVRSTPGGFSLFGEPPPETILTAYGLMEFADMARVHYVDPLLIERTAQFLIERQQADGSWNPLYRAISIPGEDERSSFVASTAYTAWALADAGYADEPTVIQALAYIAENIELATDDAYVLALAANAFVAAGDPNNAILDELASRPVDDANQSVRWISSASTWLHATGPIVGLETTAMAAIAFIRSGEHIDLAEQALRFITNSRDQFGGYGSTQATVMSLKALLLAAQMGGEGGSATVTVSLNGEREQQLTIDDSNGDVVQQIVYDDIGAEPSDLVISMEGDRAIQYQVSTEYYQPWQTTPSSTPTQPPAPQAVRIDVAYDRTELAINDIVQVTAEVELLADGMAGTLIVDLGIPPGFTPLANDLDALVLEGQIDRYELTGRQIILYMTDVPNGQVFQLPYRLQARFPIRAQAPASQVYDYYTPDQRATEPPQRIVVTLGTPN